MKYSEKKKKKNTLWIICCLAEQIMHLDISISDRLQENALWIEILVLNITLVVPLSNE